MDIPSVGPLPTCSERPQPEAARPRAAAHTQPGATQGEPPGRPPRVSPGELAQRPGLPGRSIGELQRLMREGSTLNELDWVADGHYQSKLANNYVDRFGLPTQRGSAKRNKTHVKKFTQDAANFAVGLARATLLIDENVRDHMHRKQAMRRSTTAPFVDLSVEDVRNLAQAARAAAPERRQTPPPEEDFEAAHPWPGPDV